MQPLTSLLQPTAHLHAKRIRAHRYLHPLRPPHDGDISLMNPKLHQFFARSGRLTGRGSLLPHSTRSEHVKARPTEGMLLRITGKTWSRRKKSGTLPSNFCSTTSPSRDQGNLRQFSLNLDSMFLHPYLLWLLHLS